MTLIHLDQVMSEIVPCGRTSGGCSDGGGGSSRSPQQDTRQLPLESVDVLGAMKKFLATQAEMHTDWMNEMRASHEARMNCASHPAPMPHFRCLKFLSFKGMESELAPREWLAQAHVRFPTSANVAMVNASVASLEFFLRHVGYRRAVDLGTVGGSLEAVKFIIPH